MNLFENSIIFSSTTSVSVTEVVIVFTIACITYFLAFNNFEKHLTLQRRVNKLFVVIGTLAGIGILFGRYAFWVIIAFMTIGQVYLHGVYFPKYGINGLTAEPYDKYLEVIKNMKGNK